MNMNKRIPLLFMVAIIMMGVCGCMTNNRSNSAESVRDSALSYLCGKYNDTFVAKGYSDSNWAYDYAAVTFFSEKFPEELVEVRVYKNEDGTYRFEDNYFRFSMADSAVCYLESLLEHKGIVIKVRFPGNIWTDDIGDAKTFCDWKNQGTCVMDIYVLSDVELAKEIRTDFVSAIASDKIRGSVDFCVVKSLDSTTTVNLDVILNNQVEYVLSKDQYYINADFTVEELN